MCIVLHCPHFPPPPKNYLVVILFMPLALMFYGGLASSLIYSEFAVIYNGFRPR